MPPSEKHSKSLVTAPAGHRAEDLVDFALSLAKAAAGPALRYYRTPLNVEDKNVAKGIAEFDPVTAADKAVEETIRTAIEARFPEHGIFGEEYGSSRPKAPFQWIIDPIDGTRSFMMGMPTWGTLIGLTFEGKPLAGVMSQPFTGEVFWSSSGSTAWTQGPLGKIALKTRSCESLSKAVLGSTHPSLFKTKDEWQRFDAVQGRVKLARYGGDCYIYCLLAAGQVDLVIEANLQTYDIAALIPIIEQAGGLVTTWDGRPALEGGRIIAAGDKRVYDEAMAILRN